MMESYEHRVVNGLLKSGLDLNTPEEVEKLLSSDIEIVADTSRARADLWPCIWALAATLERQFSGSVIINCGLGNPLPAPAALGPNVMFDRTAPESAIRIGVGVPINGGPRVISDDARGGKISYGTMLSGGGHAHPVSCFALAGHLGYAALAIAVGIPPFHEDFARTELTLPLTDDACQTYVDRSFVVIGLGQLGQAYLSLLFFLNRSPRLAVHLIDKDRFEKANQSTQILLEYHSAWEGIAKANYLEAKLNASGFFEAQGEVVDLDWGWRRPRNHPNLALFGLDNFEARRVAASGGYDWVVEAGVSTSFLQPKVTWHSFPPGHRFKDLFPRDTEKASPQTRFGKELKLITQDGCGWVRFNNISASAPSMGLVASAYVWAEVLSFLGGRLLPVQGVAHLWTPLLPFTRTELINV